MPGLVYKFDGCVNRGDFVEFDDVIERILRQEAHVELMQGHAIYKTRVKSNGIEKTQPRLLFSAVPSKGKAFFAVLGVVFNHNYHRSKFLQPGVLDQYLSKNVTRFLDEARHLISNEVDNARFVQSIEQRQWVPVDYHHQACYYDKQFVIPSDPQRLAISLPSPAVFSGPAGSGKSYILFEKLRELLARMVPDDEGQIIFVAKSAELAADLQTMWGTFSTSVLNNHRVVFKRYDQVLAEQDSFCAEENKASEADWFEWFTGYLNELERAADTGQIPQEWIVSFRKDPEAVFEEFRIISLYAKQSGHFTQKQYLNELGQRQSLFSRSNTSGPRDVLLKAYTDYQRHLHDSGRWDPSFREFDIPQPVYFATMVDEALDLSLLQLYLLFRLTDDAKIFYAVDSHQRLRDRISFRPALLSMLRKLTGRVFHAHLPGSYRCSNKVVRLTNELIQIKIELTGGIADQNEVKEIALSADPEKEYGDIFQLRPKKNEDVVLRDMFPSTFWAVVTREDYIEEARLRYGTSLVFTPEQIKGLGYQYIIVYKLLDDSKRLWVEANEQLGPIIEGAKVNAGRSVKGIGDSRFAPLCNNLITSVTRTIDSLFIVQDTPHELRHITSRCAKHMTPNEELGPCLSKIKALSTFDRAAMLDHAEYLLRNHRDEQARNFCIHELGLSEEAFVEFKIERLDLKTVINPSELVENEMVSDEKESESQRATLATESMRKKAQKRAKKKSAGKLGARESVISQDSSLIAPAGRLLALSNTSPSISPVTVSDLEGHLSVSTRTSANRLVGINYNEESIKALLADFTLESLTHWFSDTKAIASFAFSIKRSDGGLTSLAETILSSPLLTPIFCQFLIKSEQSITPFGLIHRLANEVEFPCGCMLSHMAAALNCVPLLEIFAAYAVDLECFDRHCRSPLFFAIWQRHQSAIDILMQSGARLSHVFDKGLLVHGESMVPFFLALDYSSPDIIDSDGRLAPMKDVSPLFRAAEKGSVSFFL